MKRIGLPNTSDDAEERFDKHIWRSIGCCAGSSHLRRERPQNIPRSWIGSFYQGG